MKNSKSVWLGALAGLAGAFAMQRFRSAWNARLPVRDGVFGLDDEADLSAVHHLLPGNVARELRREQALAIALILHYGYGAFAGAGYALLRERVPQAGVGCGTVFGIALWLVGDELAMSVTGLSDPLTKSARSHGSAWFAHVLFGASTELTLKAARQLLTR